ncbi:MAG: hypothetical protein IPN71_02370 [Fibrobacteres bacterium]|jgi:hypothetical protein|nr:hypothetical protein [Fibrobacterota bacterium]
MSIQAILYTLEPVLLDPGSSVPRSIQATTPFGPFHDGEQVTFEGSFKGVFVVDHVEQTVSTGEPVRQKTMLYLRTL